MSYHRLHLSWIVASTTTFLGMIIAACGGATSQGIGDAPAGTSSGSDAQSSGSTSSGSSGSSDGSSSADGSGPTDGAVKEDGAVGVSDPGLVSCPPGAAKCTTKAATPPPAQYCCIEPSASGLVGTCKSDVISACAGHRLGCDEAADCTEANLCCAEANNAGTGGEKVTTRCMQTCITGVQRFQVCKTSAECENNGTCKKYDCGDSIPAHLLFCEKPDGCK